MLKRDRPSDQTIALRLHSEKGKLTDTKGFALLAKHSSECTIFAMMNRRKFLVGIPLLSAAAALSYGALKWIGLKSSPDLEYLRERKQLLAALVDTIIPKTDSPSASECGVHEFIMGLIAKNNIDIKTQNKFIAGLKEVEAYADSRLGKAFDQCDQNDRNTILHHFAERDEIGTGKLARVQTYFLGSPFFVTLKQYCIIGYFTSEGGATQALRYAYVPSAYRACEPYTAGEKAWATR